MKKLEFRVRHACAHATAHAAGCTGTIKYTQGLCKQHPQTDSKKTEPQPQTHTTAETCIGRARDCHHQISDMFLYCTEHWSCSTLVGCCVSSDTCTFINTRKSCSCCCCSYCWLFLLLPLLLLGCFGDAFQRVQFSEEFENWISEAEQDRKMEEHICLTGKVSGK